MSVLTHNVILDLIKSGDIKIDPFSDGQVGPGSIDLHLGNTFRVFFDSSRVFSIRDENLIEKVSKLIEVPDGESLLLLPGSMCHGVTLERITLPPNICGWLTGRSTFGRLGIQVHATANYVQPGADCHQVLELSNNGPLSLTVEPKVLICQIVLEEGLGAATYSGRFAKQTKP